MHPGSSVVLLALILACSAAGPAAAQDEAAAAACANEVQRLADAFAIEGGDSGEMGAAIADEPGARKGASLGRQERQRVSDLVARARQAGEQGDGQGCLQHLAETRALLREAGLGGGQPGTADGTGAITDGSTGGEGPGATGTTNQPRRAPSGTTGAGSVGGGGSSSSTSSSGGGGSSGGS